MSSRAHQATTTSPSLQPAMSAPAPSPVVRQPWGNAQAVAWLFEGVEAEGEAEVGLADPWGLLEQTGARRWMVGDEGASKRLGEFLGKPGEEREVQVPGGPRRATAEGRLSRDGTALEGGVELEGGTLERLDLRAEHEADVGPAVLSGAVEQGWGTDGRRQAVEAGLASDVGGGSRVQVGGRVEREGEHRAAEGRVAVQHGDVGLSAGTRLRDGKSTTDLSASRRGAEGQQQQATLRVGEGGPALGLSSSQRDAQGKTTDRLQLDGSGADLSRSRTTANSRLEAGGHLGTDSLSGRASGRIGGVLHREQAEGRLGVAQGKAELKLLGAEASAGTVATARPGGFDLDAKAAAKAHLAEAEAALKVPGPTVDLGFAGLQGVLDLGLEAGVLAEADAALDSGLEIGESKTWAEVEAGAFAGAEAGFSAATSVRWIKDAEQQVAELKDLADSLPGNLDDALLDRVPEGVWQAASAALFGTGEAELARASARGMATAGVGAEAGASATLQGGMVEVGGRLGGALGVGGRTQAKVGVNAVELVRLGLLSRVHRLNELVGRAEAAVRGLRGGVGGR